MSPDEALRKRIDDALQQSINEGQMEALAGMVTHWTLVAESQGDDGQEYIGIFCDEQHSLTTLTGHSGYLAGYADHALAHHFHSLEDDEA